MAKGYATCDAGECEERLDVEALGIEGLREQMRALGWKVGSGDGKDPDLCPIHAGDVIEE